MDRRDISNEVCPNAFRKAVNDSEVMSWVIMLDQSERTDGSNGTFYRRSFAGALDVKVSDRMRADSARQALEYYENKKTMDDFDTRNAALDSTSLALVEVANSIGDDNYRQKAVGIADLGRKVQHVFDALRENYVNTYDLQSGLLKTIADENGNLERALTAMQKTVAGKDKLQSEGNKLRGDEEEALRLLEEQYAAFKGLTGIKVDYTQPTT